MIELRLTIEEINKILDALGNRPYVEVFQLVNKIQQQAGNQLQGENGTPPATAPTTTQG